MSLTKVRVVLQCEDCDWRWEGDAVYDGLGWVYNAAPHEHENYTERVYSDADVYTTKPAHCFVLKL